jgi:hypothetical protein
MLKTQLSKKLIRMPDEGFIDESVLSERHISASNAMQLTDSAGWKPENGQWIRIYENHDFNQCEITNSAMSVKPEIDGSDDIRSSGIGKK